MVNKELKEYLDLNILPKYNLLDLAHGVDHVLKVIDESFDIANDYNLNPDMIYTIAIFHDVGLIVNRKDHHTIGGMMLYEDEFINKYFNSDSITIMKEAVEDHRASTKNPPRTIYGKIIAQADKADNMDNVIKRCFLFDISNNGSKTFNESFKHVKHHLHDKYGVNGYLKVFLETKSVNKMLTDIRELLTDDSKLESYCYNMYLTIQNSQS